MKHAPSLILTPLFITGLAAFALTTLITAGVYVTRWAPLYEQQQSLIDQQQFYRKKIIEKSRTKNNLQTVEKQQATLSTLLEKLQAPGEDASLLQHLERHARELNITIKNFANTTSKNQGAYIATYYSLNISGPYKNTRTFLARTRKLPHFITLEKVQLKPENKSSNLRSTLTLKKLRHLNTNNGDG